MGTAVRAGDGFRLTLGELSIGAAPDTQSASTRRQAPAPGADGMVFPPYGRSKGAPVVGASIKDLEFYASGCRRTLDDPAKSRWHDKERILLAAIEAELDRQGSGDEGGSFRAMDQGEGPTRVHRRRRPVLIGSLNRARGAHCASSVSAGEVAPGSDGRYTARVSPSWVVWSPQGGYLRRWSCAPAVLQQPSAGHFRSRVISFRCRKNRACMLLRVRWDRASSPDSGGLTATG
mgnify:CR=1 FL=1